MIAPEFLDLLRCPETKQRLLPAPSELVARLETERAAGALCNRGGKRIVQPVEEGLLREDGKRFYLVSNGFPILIVGEGIDV
jgi:uncharacterized protein YbaR (Trm112 family)